MKSGWRNWHHSRGGRVVAAASSGALVRVLSSLIALLSLPLAVRYLGPERYGIWATVTSASVVLNLLDLGIAGTLTNEIAYSDAVGDRKRAARSTTNALVLTFSLAILAAVVLIAIWPHMVWMTLFNVPAGIPLFEIDHTMAAAAALMLLGLPASLTARIFGGYQEVHLLVAIGTVLNLTGLLAGMKLRLSMPALFVLATGWVTFCNLAALAALLLWMKPWLRPQLSHLNWLAAKALLSSGAGFWLIQISGVIGFSSDNVVVSHFLGPAQVTPYSVTWRLVGTAAILQGLLFPAFWPAYAEAYARNDFSWLRPAFRMNMLGTFAFNAVFALGIITFGRIFIRWWTGPAAVPSVSLLAAMAFWAVISGCMSAQSCLLAAVNRTRMQGVLSIIAAIVNLALSIFLVQRIGSTGVIGGTILSYLLVLVIPQTLIVRGVLRTSLMPQNESREEHEPRVTVAAG